METSSLWQPKREQWTIIAEICPVQIAPLAGVALVKYDGPETSQTALRLIAIRSLPNAYWTKVDFKVPFDWENDPLLSTNQSNDNLFGPASLPDSRWT